jgi:hypothetical protein
MSTYGYGYQALFNENTVYDSGTFNSITDLSLDANSLVVADSNKRLSSLVLPESYIPVGVLNSTPTARSLEGTVNQVTITFGAQTITFSLPQDMAHTSSPVFTGLTLSAPLITSSTVDGRDVSADGLKLDFLYDTIELKNTVVNEIRQIQNIDNLTISSANWGYLSNMNQNVATTSSPTFQTLTCNDIIANTLDIGEIKISGLLETNTLLVNSTSSYFGNATFTQNIRSALLTGSSLVASDAIGNLQSVVISNANGCNSSFSGSTLTNTMTQNLSSSGSPTFANIIDSGLTISKLLASDGSKQLQSVTISNTNGNNLSFSGSTLTASLSQDLQTSASPTFANLTLTRSIPTLTLLPNDLAYNGSTIRNASGTVYFKNSDNASFVYQDSASNEIFRINTNTQVSTCQNLIDNALTATKLLASDASKQLQSVTIANSNGCDLSFSGFTLTASMTQNVSSSGSPSFVNLTCDDVFVNNLSPSLPVKTNGSNKLISAGINLTSDVISTLPIANGGTNNAIALTNGKLMVSSGGSIIEGTSNSTPTFSSINLSSISNQIIAGSSPNFSTLHFPASAGSITLTMPNTTDTMVARNTTDTLTNKTLTSPTINTPVINGATLSIDDTDSLFNLLIRSTSTNTADRTLTFDVNNSNRTLDLGGNITLGGSFTTTPSNDLTFTTVGATNITLPTSGTVITTTGTETLSNKKLIDNSVTFVDDGDNTKQLAFQCSGISTATTRTVTIQNSSGTMPLLEATQTFTGTNSFSNAILPTTNITTDIGSTSFRWRNLLLGRSSGVVQLGIGLRTTNRAELMLMSHDPGTNNVSTDIMMGNTTGGAFNEDDVRWDISARGVNEDENLNFFMGPSVTGSSGTFTRAFTIIGETTTKGNVVIGTSNTSTNKLRVEGDIRSTATTNQLVLSGPTRTLTISAVQPATSSRTVTFPDPTGDCDVVYSISNQTITGIKSFNTSIKLLSSGGTASELNHYEEYTDASATASGPWAVAKGITYNITRIGRLVNLMISSASGASTVNTHISCTTLPARFQPTASSLVHYTYVTDNSVTVSGNMSFSAGSPHIHVGQASTGFTASGNAGFGVLSVSYYI